MLGSIQMVGDGEQETSTGIDQWQKGWEPIEVINKLTCTNNGKWDCRSQRWDCNICGLWDLLIGFGWEKTAFEGVSKTCQARKITVCFSHHTVPFKWTKHMYGRWWTFYFSCDQDNLLNWDLISNSYDIHHCAQTVIFFFICCSVDVDMLTHWHIDILIISHHWHWHLVFFPRNNNQEENEVTGPMRNDFYPSKYIISIICLQLEPANELFYI